MTSHSGAKDTGTWTAVLWNLNEARSPKKQSWQVLDEIGADLALLSEARISDRPEALGHGKTIGRDCKHADENDCRGRPWSTAIVSPDEASEILDARARRRGRPLDIPFKPSRPGTWVAASVSIPELGDVTAVSLYGLTDEKTDASVHRSLSDLEPLFEDPNYNRLLLLGGDLNVFANPRPDDPARERHLLVLERIRAYGLVDLFERDLGIRGGGRDALGKCPCGQLECGHVWTFRSRDPRLAEVRYQDDHAFASSALANLLVSCESLGFNDASDHAPILATFRKRVDANGRQGAHRD